MKSVHILYLVTIFIVAHGCSMDTVSSVAANSTESQEIVTLNDNEALLIYERGVSGEVPEKTSLRDGSCWNLAKVTAPWEVSRVTSSAFTLEAPTDALRVPNNGLDHDYQRTVSISYFFKPDFSLARAPSSARMQELIKANYAYEDPEYSMPPFTAYRTGRGPAKIDDDIFLYDDKQGISCEVIGTRVPNPVIFCAKSIDGRVMYLRLPRAAVGELAERIKNFNELFQELECK